jgi:diacylglycerol kinase family enzyme
LLVANPTARSGDASGAIREALGALRARGMGVTLLHTEPERGTIRRVRERLDAEGFDVVVYLGGDGTFHEVATGILGARRRVPLGMLPNGTANDQGLSFGVERGDFARNVAVIAAGHITELDVGSVEKLDHTGAVAQASLFFDSVGWGIHPDILELRNRQRSTLARIPLLRRIYRDKSVYIGATVAKLLESYFTPVKFAAEVVADGVRHELRGMTDVIIKATAIYGGGWVLDRNGAPDDGKFELVTMAGRRDWASKAIRDHVATPIWQEHLDLLGITHSTGFAASRFVIDFYRPERGELKAQLDGDEWGSGDRYRVEVLPRLLPLITPGDWRPTWKR